MDNFKTPVIPSLSPIQNIPAHQSSAIITPVIPGLSPRQNIPTHVLPGTSNAEKYFQDSSKTYSNGSNMGDEERILIQQGKNFHYNFYFSISFTTIYF